MGKKKIIVSKRRIHATQTAKCKGTVEVRKAKINMKTSQDPFAGITDMKHVPNEQQYLECGPSEHKIDVAKQEQIEVTIESGDDDKKDYNKSRSDTLHEIRVNEKIEVLEQEELTIENDDDEKDSDESRSDTLRETLINEELVVRRQLCRSCHSDGAFWSLQTVTEGDTYGDLLQTYCNIQLCPVSKDEHVLSAICTLCATRLREARAFFAQARAAEERFTRLYKQNCVKALVNEIEIEIKQEVPKVKNEAIRHDEIKQEVPKVKNEVDDLEITDDGEPDTAKSNLVFRLSPSDYECVGNLFKCTRCDELYDRSGIHEHVTNVHFQPSFQHSIFEGNSKHGYKLTASDFERVGDSYKCHRCEKLFANYKRVSSHVRHTHLKIPRDNYNCPHCDKTFHNIGHFTKHKLEEHSIDDRLLCDACDYFTYRKSELNKHKKGFHMLGEKRTCPDCDYYCFSVSAMKRHGVKHSTVKKHHCKYCKKSFLRKSNLNSHERIHTGDKRKVCNVCGQAFVQRASLTYHMAKHHPEVRF